MSGYFFPGSIDGDSSRYGNSVFPFRKYSLLYTEKSCARGVSAIAIIHPVRNNRFILKTYGKILFHFIFIPEKNQAYKEQVYT